MSYKQEETVLSTTQLTFQYFPLSTLQFSHIRSNYSPELWAQHEVLKEQIHHEMITQCILFHSLIKGSYCVTARMDQKAWIKSISKFVLCDSVSMQIQHAMVWKMNFLSTDTKIDQFNHGKKRFLWNSEYNHMGSAKLSSTFFLIQSTSLKRKIITTCNVKYYELSSRLLYQ